MQFVKTKLTVLIGTCDKYQPLWENFTTCFNKYWRLDTRNIVVGETKPVLGFETILPGTGLCWGERMLEGIENCSDYIFFILDDYFLSDFWEEDLFKKYIEDIEKHNINCLQISPSDYQTYSTERNCPYLQISDFSQYIISMQPSIWRKSYLQQVLLSHYSPWDFELAGTHVLNVNGDPFLQKKWRVYRDGEAPKRYFNAVRKGFVKCPGWEEFKEKENLKDF
tara:strand:- start:2838 stop:3506 length:669 start_codon:yes stop_codon:yes gene_type:complete